eukprot:GHVS01021618.1.p2 GENE.GHVS01021618.1~~GHVS01021618.1.p2  ORF type:complete len:152 (-),score=23.63 GHVS01021618.1:310-765(-)
MGSVYVLIIVGKGDCPLFEIDLSKDSRRDDTPHLDQFIIHQSLDIVDELVWQSNALVLKNVDSFNCFHVTALCSAGHVKFMLLYKIQGTKGGGGGGDAGAAVESSIRLFLHDVHECFIKQLMNPLYEINGLITSPVFATKVRLFANKHNLV